MVGLWGRLARHAVKETNLGMGQGQGPGDGPVPRGQVPVGSGRHSFIWEHCGRPAMRRVSVVPRVRHRGFREAVRVEQRLTGSGHTGEAHSFIKAHSPGRVRSPLRNETIAHLHKVLPPPPLYLHDRCPAVPVSAAPRQRSQ